ncbi:FAD-binding domain-containing protein [Marasmius fiardii PR-910]|nr:FAD-binding domain-containing protein [Marasmius fiardii PR-910]
MLLTGAVVAAFLAFAAGKSSTCRKLPTDSSWPSKDVWDAFNSSVDGRLIKTVPIGSPCHDPTYDEEKCKIVRENWHIPVFHEANPSSVMDHIYLNKSCDPFDPRETPCKIGAYVQYAVNVSSHDHVIKAVQFVKEHNIRFVVKNTGHDYMGRSTGTGALSVWMHHLKETRWIPEYEGSTYRGPAFKVQTGVIGIDMAIEARRRGVIVNSPEAPDVAFAGGFIQGGGISRLSTTYGLAADNTLEFEVITTEGEFVRASPTENRDLYWALSGGGGGTYGIVWSATVKAHPDGPVTIGSLNFTSKGITQDKFWKALDAYQATTPKLTDAGLWAGAHYSTEYFVMYPLFGIDKTPAELSALLQPLVDTLIKLGVNYTSNIKSFDTYFDGWASNGFLEKFKPGKAVFGSRLLPRSIWEDEQSFESFTAATRSILLNEPGVTTVFELIQKLPPDEGQNAVLPAWREAERHFMTPLVDGESLEDIHAKQDKITYEILPALRDLTPHSGVYHNEGDPNEPDFRQAFYGSNYDTLLAIKDKWDPDQVLYGATSVGGDRWFEAEEGRLCVAERYGEDGASQATSEQLPLGL